MCLNECICASSRKRQYPFNLILKLFLDFLPLYDFFLWKKTGTKSSFSLKKCHPFPFLIFFFPAYDTQAKAMQPWLWLGIGLARVVWEFLSLPPARTSFRFVAFGDDDSTLRWFPDPSGSAKWSDMHKHSVLMRLANSMVEWGFFFEAIALS